MKTLTKNHAEQAITFREGSAEWLNIVPLETPWGAFGAAFTETGALAVLSFPQKSVDRTLEWTAREGQIGHRQAGLNLAGECAGLQEFQQQLNEYLNRQRKEFKFAVQPGNYGEFCLAVWKAAAKIGFGQSVSYAQLAAMTGHERAFRATGTALGRNPIPILIPCHRILKSGGDLGGYSGGLEWKTRLLELET